MEKIKEDIRDIKTTINIQLVLTTIVFIFLGLSLWMDAERESEEKLKRSYIKSQRDINEAVTNQLIELQKRCYELEKWVNEHK